MQKRLLSRTDEEITESRFFTAASLAPNFNSKAVSLDGFNVSSAEALFNMPPPPAVESDDSLPWRTVGRSEGKVWVVLLTAPAGDPTSRGFNKLFNDTLNIISPPNANEPVGASISKLVLDPFQDSPDEGFSREDDVEQDEASRLSRARRQRVEESRKHARAYNFAVADYEYTPDLAWAWWVWKVPVLVFVTPSTSPGRLYDLRFWKVAFISGLTPEYILTYVASGAWKSDLKVWKGTLAPGGARSWIPASLAKPSNWAYDNFSRVPSWIVGLMSTLLGGSLISLMHGQKSGNDKKQARDKKTTAAGSAIESTADTTARQAGGGMATVKRA